MRHTILKYTNKLKLITLMIAFLVGTLSSVQAQDSKGTEFWICFPGNLSDLGTELYITATQASTVTIDIPGIGFNTVVGVAAGGLQTIPLPFDVQVQSQFIAENKGIHITATTEVTVYGMNAKTATTDAYLAFPLDAIGKDYYVMGYTRDFSSPQGPAQATIVATDNNTTITITSSFTDGGFIAGIPTAIVLQQGQVFQLRSGLVGADYTGTKITADKPISVFGGAQCTNISGALRACDHLVEQLPTLNSWGKSFITVPLATRLAGDVFRFMAQTNGTDISVNGSVVASINEGQFFETILSSTSYNRITANQPILVGQYSRSSQADGVTSDPFFALVPPDEQFLNSYIISAGTLNIPTNFVNITSPNSNIGNVQIDGMTVNPALWVPVAGTSFSGAVVPVSVGVHAITSVLPIGALVYGFGSFDSYGYLGGQSFSPVATVTNLSLTPETGTGAININRCWDALVTDQFNAPVAGVRVDFNITGPNSGSTGFAITDANGIANFCYTGTLAGTDAITASVGSITDNASYTWTAGCNITVTAKKFYDLNANGIDDDNLPVPGWNITLSGTDVNNVAVGPVNQVTGVNGTTAFTNLDKGTYTVSEGSVSGWVATTATSANLNLTTCDNPPQINFGNVCLGGANTGGGGLGFWANKNGQALITGAFLCNLNALCLRNANGSNYDPISGCSAPTNAQVNAGKNSLKNWLLNAYATNMSYMLSAQLAALRLNVLQGYVDVNRLIYAPGTSSANAAGFATVSSIMVEANTILCANGIINSGNPLRARAEAVKNALESASSNRNYIQLQPCAVARPAMASKAATPAQNVVVDNAKQSMIAISARPNPSRDYFNIALGSINKTERMSLRVFDLHGRVIYKREGLKAGQNIQVGKELQPGTYLIEIVQGTDRTTQTVIKQ